MALRFVSKAQKAMWKLGCFLRDFLYYAELLAD
jgi:hypothetical protein